MPPLSPSSRPPVAAVLGFLLAFLGTFLLEWAFFTLVWSIQGVEPDPLLVSLRLSTCVAPFVLIVIGGLVGRRNPALAWGVIFGSGLMLTGLCGQGFIDYAGSL